MVITLFQVLENGKVLASMGDLPKMAELYLQSPSVRTLQEIKCEGKAFGRYREFLKKSTLSWLWLMRPNARDIGRYASGLVNNSLRPYKRTVPLSFVAAH
jgi:hypothetical protein